MQVNHDQVMNLVHKGAVIVGAGLVATAKDPTNPSDPRVWLGGIITAWAIQDSHKQNATLTQPSTTTK